MPEMLRGASQAGCTDGADQHISRLRWSNNDRGPSSTFDLLRSRGHQPAQRLGPATTGHNQSRHTGQQQADAQPLELDKAVRMPFHLSEAGRAGGRWFVGPALSRSVLTNARARTGNYV